MALEERSGGDFTELLADVPAQARASCPYRLAAMAGGLPNLHLHDEEHLRVRTGAERMGLPPMVLALLDAPGAKERQSIVRAALADCGFEWLSYMAFVRKGNRMQPHSLFTTYVNPGWTRAYLRQYHAACDALHEQLPASGVPMAWDIQELDRHCATLPNPRGVHAFVQAVRGHGIGSGVLFQLPTPGAPSSHTVVGLTSSQSTRQNWPADALGHAVTLGICLHEFLTAHVEKIDICEEMTATQRAILACLREGHSDKQIAWHLQLSLSAVDYHMRQLRRRFAVRNRTQLVQAPHAL